VIETARLVLRRLEADDAEFIVELLNDPDWLRFIGDKNVHSIADARGYIASGPVAMYAREGFGLYLTERKDDAVPIGMCGLIKRDSLPDVDIGFAFLPAFRGQGYALEAATAVLALGSGAFGLRRIVAITSPDNDRSIALLEKLGMKAEAIAHLGPGESATAIFARHFG
jgi:RimJ/RimL family protein N-acetyltransferase